MKKHISYFTCILLMLPIVLVAQEKKIDFFGSGRFALNNGSINGALLNTDSVTPRKQMRGSTLFDLGFHIKPSAETEIKAITRVTNDINGFWGGGIVMNVRELYLRGLLLKKFKYQVGDLNTRMTPFTLYNAEGELSLQNPEALNTFSEVIAYDKFYGENSWRQQGAQIDFGFKFNEVFNSMKIKGLIAKNRQTDYFSTPDRLFSAATADFTFFKNLGLQYNLAHIFDVRESAMFSDARFSNTVHSFGLTESFSIKQFQFKLSGEAGFSKVAYENMLAAPNIPTGNFATASLTFNPSKAWYVKLHANRVETHFRSMGAQSRRVNFNAVASEYAYYTNRESVRPANMLDILTDGNYYNLFLTPNLQGFNPVYENILPYGQATPNRQGAQAELGFRTKAQLGLFTSNMRVSRYNEISGQGTINTRNFSEIQWDANSNINHFYHGKRRLNLSVFYRLQNTQREGIKNIEEIQLNTSQVKLGVAYEVVPKLHLQMGLLLVQAKGNEFMPTRNAFNQVVFYERSNYDLNETLFLGGINYQFSKHNCLKIQWQQVNWNNELLPQNQYGINRLSVLYNLFF